MSMIDHKKGETSAKMEANNKVSKGGLLAENSSSTTTITNKDIDSAIYKLRCETLQGAAKRCSRCKALQGGKI